MNRLLLCPVLILFLLVDVQADIGDTPDQTLLWGQYRAVRIVDGYALALADEGVAVCRWDEGSGQFVHTNQLIIKDRPYQMRVFGEILIIRTLHDNLVLVDVGSLPDIARLGAVHPGTEFDDFVLHGNDLYISVWFRGVWRFTGPSFNEMTFADSVMKPILCSQMFVENHTLHVLDEYNGLVRYDLNGPGFGRLMDYLWIPFRASSVYPFAEQWLISGRNKGLYLGEYGRSGSGVVGEIGQDRPSARRAWTTDSLLITATDRFAYVYDRHSFDSLGVIAIGEDRVNGDVTYLLGEYKLVLPGSRGGLVLYSLESPGDADLAYYRPGPIAGLAAYDGLLFTGGLNNPVDVFAVSDNGLSLRHTLYDDLTGVVDLTRIGDTLLVLYGGIGKVALILSCDDPDSAYIERSFFVQPVSARRIEWHSDWPLGAAGLTVMGEEDIAVYTITDDKAVVHTTTWHSPGAIVDAVRVGSTLAISTVKRNILLYRLDDDLNSTFVKELGLGSSARELLEYMGLLMYFAGNSLYLLDIDEPSAPQSVAVIDLSLPVAQAVWSDDNLYTVGPGGVAVYDWSGDSPVLLDSGGLPGIRIAVEGGVVVTTGGGSVNCYRIGPSETPGHEESLPALFAVSQNYPNPFNSRTAIQFSLTQSASVRIDIFNALGRRVTTLLDRQYPSGEHTVVWNGENSDGGQVASGVYFYRLQAGSQVTSRKMVLLK